jgi:hypothetical protein
LKNAGNVLARLEVFAGLEDIEAWEIGTSGGPIDADGNGPQRAVGASGMGFGREDATCDVIEIMQIPPRFEQ